MRSARMLPTTLPFSRTLSAWMLAAALMASATHVGAQAAPASSVSSVTASPKGVIGLAILGAELGLFVPALFPATDWWPYVVFPAIGAIGGGIGGYFLDEATRNQPEISIAFLIAGVVLAVPTVVGTLALTQYRPDSDANAPDEPEDAAPIEDGTEAVEDTSSEVTRDPEPTPQAAPENGEPSNTPAPQGSAAPQSRLLEGGPGLIRWTQQGIFLGAPMVEARGTYTSRELSALRLQQAFDVHVPVVSGTF